MATGRKTAVGGGGLSWALLAGLKGRQDHTHGGGESGVSGAILVLGVRSVVAVIFLVVIAVFILLAGGSRGSRSIARRQNAVGLPLLGLVDAIEKEGEGRPARMCERQNLIWAGDSTRQVNHVVQSRRWGGVAH